VEQIDIGGPAMVRAAAKVFRRAAEKKINLLMAPRRCVSAVKKPT